MATRNRLPGSSDFQNASYWGGGVPADTDTLIIGVGADAFSVNVDQSGQDFTAVTFDTGYGDQSTVIGSASGPLKFDCDQTSTGIVTFAGSCKTLNLAGGTGGVFSTLKWRPVNPSAMLMLNSVTISTRCELQGGQSTIGQAVTLGSTLIVYSGTHRVMAHTAGTDVPTIVVVGGTLIMERDWTLITVHGGEVILDLDDGSTGGTVTANAGKVTHIRGSCAAVQAFAAVYDRSRIAKPYTVTDLKMHPGSTLIREKGSLLATISATTYYGSGPKIV